MTRFILPGLLAAACVSLAGYWIGTEVGVNPATAGTYTLTTTLKGRVVRIRGHQKVVVHAQTITKNGHTVTLPARTFDLTRVLPGQTITRTQNGTVVRTVVRTRRVPVTVTGPSQTITQTETSTVSVPVTSVVTVTGPTTTIVSTVTETVTT